MDSLGVGGPATLKDGPRGRGAQTSLGTASIKRGGCRLERLPFCASPPAKVRQEMAIEFETFKLPYYRAIPLGLEPGSWVLLEGFIPKQSKGFHMDFAYGQFPGASIPLQFRLSFGGPLTSSAMVALNSFTGREWGKEKKTASHLQQGHRFKIQFIITSKGYKIMENDTFLYEFEHRLSPKRIRFLEMDGDIKLEKVTFDWESRGANRNRVPTSGGSWGAR